MNQNQLLFLVCLPRQLHIQKYYSSCTLHKTLLPIFHTCRLDHVLLTCLAPIGKAIQETIDSTSAQTLQGIRKTCTWRSREIKKRKITADKSYYTMVDMVIKYDWLQIIILYVSKIKPFFSNTPVKIQEIFQVS